MGRPNFPTCLPREGSGREGTSYRVGCPEAAPLLLCRRTPVRTQPSNSPSRTGRDRQRSATAGGTSGGVELDYPLGAALRWWRGRGYAVTYAEPRLVQVARSHAAPERGGLVLLALLLLSAGGIVLNLALRRRVWHTVTLTIGPDGRVFTHRLWTRRPPRSE